MAKGKRRRQVVWRAVSSVDHAWIVGHVTSACEGFALRDSGIAEGRERCRNCEITLEQMR